jgi:hypothetical protein
VNESVSAGSERRPPETLRINQGQRNNSNLWKQSPQVIDGHQTVLPDHIHV